MNQKAVFIDRDGTIVEDVPYCNSPRKIRLLEGAGKAIRRLNDQGFLVILITNQSGVARGYFSEETLGEIHNKLKEDLGYFGAHLDDIFYCPHHPAQSCTCRKPATGLIDQAVAKYGLDISGSYFIGDRLIDIQAANRSGCQAVLVPYTSPETDYFKLEISADSRPSFLAGDISAAVDWVLADALGKAAVSVVIPTLNEEKNICSVLPRLRCVPGIAEVILVDGRSTDKTVENALRLWPEIKVINQPGRGKGDAMRAGFEAACGDIVVTLDADGSLAPEEIPRYVGPLFDGYQMVKGSRFCRGGGTSDMPLFRRFGNFVFTKMANLVCGCRYTDLVYGYHAFRRQILGSLCLKSDGFEIDTEMYIRATRKGLKVKEVPSYEAKRLEGAGKLRSFHDGARILRTILRESVNG
ncbi:MAG: histidinol-phosphate phosphatase family protein/glycosyl transferase, group 2 family protein [Dehalococcoides mccartyi]|uniref:HAD-IIIA family hydrolase n=2 Tax=Dehalococcoides mccartyi TaxID=61435 RepID=UPI00242AE59F|nr:HAD-IIIA family hydrolase [Dehalococcoides mccartyi]MCF7634685.1 histidinol-phosphate phosphatase family protein/glycosyl transferase, group 2 family protein [Dehalococcoides mccartyi]